MTLYILRRTLISASSASFKHESTNLTHFPYFVPSFSLSTLVTKSEKTPCSEIKEFLINDHKLSPETASIAAPFLMHSKNYKRSGLVLDYLKESGLSQTQVEDLVERDPRVLAIDFRKNMMPRVEKIRELGFSGDDLVDMLSSVPGIFLVNNATNRVISSIAVLQRVMDSNLSVIKLLKACDWFLSSDLDKTMMPNIEMLESCGVSLSQIRQVIFSFPRFLLQKPEYVRDCVRRVEEMGLSRDSKMFIYGIRAVSSMSLEKWGSKLAVFRSLGFNENDILTVFRRTPQVFAVSEGKLMEVSKLLLSSGDLDISFVVRHSELLIYSAKGRIKPRLQIIRMLQAKKLLKREPSMTFICKLRDEDFIRKYVLPFTCELGEAGDKYIASRGLVV